MTVVAWLALRAEVPADADLFARLHDPTTGADAGLLVAWWQPERPSGADARRADRRLLDPDGAAGLLSLVLPPEDALVPFDDLAVQQARRQALAEIPADALSTLLVDDRRFAGAVTVRRGPDAERLLRADPFARLGPAQLLWVDAGLLGTVPAPTGPTIERHGSAQPWPWDRFAAG